MLERLDGDLPIQHFQSVDGLAGGGLGHYRMDQHGNELAPGEAIILEVAKNMDSLVDVALDHGQNGVPLAVRLDIGFGIFDIAITVQSEHG